MSDGSEPPRPPRDIQGLLRLCMETVPQDQTSSASQLHPLDPERRQWLSGALNGMTTDVIQEMVKCVDQIKSGLNESTTEGLISMETVDRMESAIESLIDFTGNLDNARDFYQLGGFELFRPLLASKVDSLKSKTCELLAEVVQNETNCQTYALDNHLLTDLVELLDKSDNERVRIKSLYAISSLIRDNQSAQQVFESDLDGLQVLLRAIDSTNPFSLDNKIRIKASFLMTSLCRKPSTCDSLYALGVLDQLIGALQGEHDSTHEHLLAALYVLVSTHQPSRTDCLRRQFGLKNLLKQRIEDLKGKEEFLEELNYCKQLLDLLFIDNNLPESER